MSRHLRLGASVVARVPTPAVEPAVRQDGSVAATRAESNLGKLGVTARLVAIALLTPLVIVAGLLALAGLVTIAGARRVHVRGSEPAGEAAAAPVLRFAAGNQAEAFSRAA